MQARTTIGLWLVLSAALFLYALPALAADFGGLVHCGKGDDYCTLCDLLELIDRIKNFIFFYVVPVGGTLMVVIAGFYFVLAGQIPGNVQKAKDILKNTFWGILIIGFSWLFTNTIIQTLAKEDNISRSWTHIECRGPSPAPSPTPTPVPTKTPLPLGTLSEEEARRQLAAAGVGWNADPPQTVLEGVRQQTINAIISLKQRCKCSVTITGGTEIGYGHVSGMYSHANGYKVDLRLDEGLNTFVVKNFTRLGVRSDGALMYLDSVTQAVYALEGNHWDVVVK